MADGSIHIDTKLDSSGLESGLKSLGGIAAKGFAAVGTAISAVGGYAVKVGSDFKAAMSEVQAISGSSGDELQMLTDRAKEMGASTKFSASESAAALKYMAMAGWDAKSMYDALPGVMNLAASSGEDLARVSDIVTDAMTAFGLQSDEAGHFADVLAKTASSANTNVGLMGESFKYVAPLAGSLGFSIEDVSTALGLMANAGIKGSQAGTALRSMLTRLSTAPTDAVANTMAEFGISMTDASGKMKPLSQLMVELRQAFGGCDEETQAYIASTLAGQEAMSGFLAIINSSDEDFNKLTASISDSKDAAADMAKIMQDNLQGDITIMKSALEGLGIQIYESLDKPLRSAAQTGTEMVNQLLDALNDGGLDNMVAVAGDVLSQIVTKVASFAPTLINLSTSLIKSFLDGLKNNSPQIVEAAVGIGTSFVGGITSILPTLVQTGMSLLAQLVEGIANALPTLMTMAADCVSQLASGIIQEVPNLASAASKMLSSLGNYLRDGFPQLVAIGLDLVLKLVESITSSAPSIVEGATSLVEGLIDGIINSLPMLVETVPRLIQAIISGITANASLLINGAVGLLQALVEGLVVSLPMLAEGAAQIILSLVQGIMDNIPTLIAAVPQIIAAIVSAIVECGPKLLEAGFQIVTELISGMKESTNGLIRLFGDFAPVILGVVAAIGTFQAAMKFSSLVSAAQSAFSTIGSAVTGFGSVIGIAKTAVSGLWTTLSANPVAAVIAIVAGLVTVLVTAYNNCDWFRSIVDGLWQGIKTAFAGIKDAVSKAMSAVSQTFSAAWSGIQAAWSGVSSFFAGIWSGIKTTFATVGSFFSTAFSGAWSGIKAVWDGVSGYFSMLWNTIKGIFAVVKSVLSGDFSGAWEAIKGIWNGVSSYFTGIWNSIRSAFSAVGSFFSSTFQSAWSGIRSAFGSVSSFFSGVWNSIKSAFASAVSSFSSIGKNIVQGLWNGINSMVSWITGKIKGFTSSIVSGFKNLLGIKSPSRVMRDEIGKMMGKGVAIGVTASTQDVRKSMRDLRDSALDIDLADKMRSVVSSRVSGADSNSSSAKFGDSASGNAIDYDMLAKKIWEHAPETSINMDGEKVADLIEPRVSEKQARKVEANERRRGTRNVRTTKPAYGV